MAPKIIKYGTTQASKAKPVSFSENIAELPLRFADQIAGEDKSPRLNAEESVLHQSKLLISEESAKPDLDLSQVEKNAYKEGFQQGEKAGMEIAEKKVEAVMRRYAEAIHQFGKLKASLYTQVEHEVVKLAVEVAKKIVHREIQADQEIIQTLVKVALSHVAEKSAVTVHLSPIDYNFLLEHRAELSQGDGRDVVLLADKSIERGGCLIQTECGQVDARIEEEFQEVEHAFFKGFK